MQIQNLCSSYILVHLLQSTHWDPCERNKEFKHVLSTVPGHLPFELLPWCYCGLSFEGQQLHSPVKLPQVCYQSRSPRLAVHRRSLPNFSFLVVLLLCEYVIVMLTWALNCSSELPGVSKQEEGEVDGTGIRRPELALVIHAKATPLTLPPSSACFSTLHWLYLDYPLATCYRKETEYIVFTDIHR